MQKQIKISVSEKLFKIIERKSKKMGTRPTTYCFNLVFEQLRKEAENNE